MPARASRADIAARDEGRRIVGAVKAGLAVGRSRMPLAACSGEPAESGRVGLKSGCRGAYAWPIADGDAPSLAIADALVTSWSAALMGSLLTASL